MPTAQTSQAPGQAPFATWTKKDAAAAVERVVKATVGLDAYTANAAVAERHDHWQDGVAWVGPTGGTPELWAAAKKAIERQFVPVDVIGEVLERQADAMLAVEPDVQFVPRVPPVKTDGTPDEDALQRLQTEADTWRAAVAAWWDRVRLWDQAHAAEKRSRWAARGLLRVWIPSGQLVNGSLPTNLTLDDAFRRIAIDAPEPRAAAIVVDYATQERAAVVITKDPTDAKAKEVVEVWYIDRANPQAPQTIVRVLREEGEQSDGGTASAGRGSAGPGTGPATAGLELGGRLPVAEMQASLLITEPVRRQQNRLNYFETVLVRSVETAGFPERYITNAAPHGKWLDSPPSDGSKPLDVKEQDGKKWYLHPETPTLGASVTTHLRGFPYDTGEATASGGSRMGFTTPSVTFKDPTDPDFAIKSAEHARATILRSCRQGHVLDGEAATLSGESRKQARAEFKKDLERTAGPLSGMIRDTIECAVAFAELMGARAQATARQGGAPAPAPSNEGGQGQQGPQGRRFLDRFRCVVTLHVDAGPATADEVRETRELVKDRLISEETGMARVGVEDVDGELERIRASERARLERANLQGEVFNQWAAATSAEFAARMAELTEEQLAELEELGGFEEPDDEELDDDEDGNEDDDDPPPLGGGRNEDEEE